MDYFNKVEKIKNKNKTSPNNSDIKKAEAAGIELGKNWNAYSRESRIHVYVKNMNDMIRFYNKILEFPVVKQWKYNDGDGTIINIGGNAIELFSRTKRNYYHKDYSGCVSFSIKVKDVKKLHDKFSRKNIHIEDIIKNPWGDSSFSLKDPEGNRICFFSTDISNEKYYKVRIKNTLEY